jgi:hypothetical protein
MNLINPEYLTKKRTNPLFFVHIPKNMGNFIYKNYLNVGQTDKTRFYGLYDSIYNYFNIMNIKFSKNSLLDLYDSTISIDHLTPFELLKLHIMNLEESNQYFYIAILREPMERFLSLCNYWDISPNQLIYNISKIDILKKTKYNLYQHLRPQSDYINDLKHITHNYRIFTMAKKGELRDFLLEYFPDKNVDFEERVYKSRDKYNESMLSNENKIFIHKYYKEDFNLFNQY